MRHSESTWKVVYPVGGLFILFKLPFLACKVQIIASMSGPCGGLNGMLICSTWQDDNISAPSILSILISVLLSVCA